LAVCNIVLALGLLVYTLLIDVYYNVDSFDTLMALMGGNNNKKASGGKLWHFAKVGNLMKKFHKNKSN
jgi:hypothetical protein